MVSTFLAHHRLDLLRWVAPLRSNGGRGTNGEEGVAGGEAKRAHRGSSMGRPLWSGSTISPTKQATSGVVMAAVVAGRSFLGGEIVEGPVEETGATAAMMVITGLPGDAAAAAGGAEAADTESRGEILRRGKKDTTTTATMTTTLGGWRRRGLLVAVTAGDFYRPMGATAAAAVPVAVAAATTMTSSGKPQASDEAVSTAAAGRNLGAVNTAVRGSYSSGCLTGSLSRLLQ